MNKKLYIETYGCQMNVADSEVVASIMKMAGYDVTEAEADADAIFSTRARSARTPRTRYTIALKRSTPSKRRAESSSWVCWAAWPSV